MGFLSNLFLIRNLPQQRRAVRLFSPEKCPNSYILC